MKFVFLASALALSLSVAGCGGDNTLQGATGYIYATNPQPQEPPEGVYPDCKYGVYPPDAGMGLVCPPPAPN
jgi:hypothetical protein